MFVICAVFPDSPQIWYFVGVADGLPVLSLARSAARPFTLARARAGVRWCWSVCRASGFLLGVRFRACRQ